MRPSNTWLYGLGLSGILAFGLAGCGGGDVPDPGSDELAATEDAGDGPAEPTAPEPIAAEAPPPPAGEAIAEPAAPPPAGQPPAAGQPSAAVETTPPADVQAAATKSDTADLLALATGAASPPSAPAETDSAPGSTPGAFPGAELGPQPGAGDLMTPPGGLGGRGGERGPGFLGGEEGSSGIPGALGLGGSGGPGANDPGDTTSAHGAVKAFLYALKQKDRERLSEATALRASTDEGGKYREFFSRIIDQSISDAELDDLATKLEGFVDAGDNQVKSTGRQGVTIRKTLKDGGWLQRTVTVRREKKGWGVLDVSGPTEFKNAPARGGRRR
ncbi:hypothetical protein [Planctomyces sp. SH-PL62]|uniref:hypothetical protein n=1 Tax=Planctomyces sp. SH-PL62 TaxID=1636152 RepID=UPI00078D7EBE|nr:hypothetical protein [Planctomyces sp. SH-PL62]AMV38960.1 hypothetical protein VT85_16105 [Planctomyces sp. SH-PL62]